MKIKSPLKIIGASVLVVALLGWWLSPFGNQDQPKLGSTTTMWVFVCASGSGGNNSNGNAGGGAGGCRENTTLAVTAGTAYTVTVGAAGTANDTTTGGNASSFSTLIQTVGGGGPGRANANGGNGGSGGGGGRASGTGGSGTAGEGNSGGAGTSAGCGRGGGGGGVNAAASGFTGGTGITTTISGSSVTYGVGGDGGQCVNSGNHNPGSHSSTNGSGGGGSDPWDNGGATDGIAGVVIVRWTTADWGAISCTGTQTTSGTDTICTFNSTDTGETFTPVAASAAGGGFQNRAVIIVSWALNFKVENPVTLSA